MSQENAPKTVRSRRAPRQQRGQSTPKLDASGKPVASEPGGELVEKTIFINRCAKVVKGGRRFSFSALLVIGDKNGKISIGFGKANEVSEAIRKASERGRKGLKEVALHNATIPHEVIGTHGGGRVLLKPASPGTGIIAGGAVRVACEAVGIKDVLAKSMGSSNHGNVLKATIDAFSQLRKREDFMRMRGIPVKPAPSAAI